MSHEVMDLLQRRNFFTTTAHREKYIEAVFEVLNNYGYDSGCVFLCGSL